MENIHAKPSSASWLVLLSLNATFIQLGFAAGAGIGGIVVGGSSILAICWIGAVSVAVAIVGISVAFRRTSSNKKEREIYHEKAPIRK